MAATRAAAANEPRVTPGDAAAAPWPPAVREYVTRAFGACRSEEERSHVERNMTTYLERAYDEGWLWHTDWEHEPLPVRHAPQQVAPGHVD